MASALLHALKQYYPHAEITWLAQPETAALLQDHPDLHQVLIWPRQQWSRLLKNHEYRQWWQAVRQFVTTLRGHSYDWILDIQGLLKSGIWAWLAKGQRKLGLNPKEGSRWFYDELIYSARNEPRISSEYLAVARYLQLPVTTFPMSMPVQVDADEVITETSDYIVICPFTTRPQKHWFDDDWVELIQRLSKPVIMLGGPGDRQHAEQLAIRSPSLINCVGQTSLQQASAIIRQADLVIGVDTGLTHLAIAHERNTIALFGSTIPYRDAVNQNVRILYHPLSCSPCRRQPSCHKAYTCMRLITPDEVLQTQQTLC